MLKLLNLMLLSLGMFIDFITVQSIGQYGLGQPSWMRIPPSMLGKRITVIKDGKPQQIIFSTNGTTHMAKWKAVIKQFLNLNSLHHLGSFLTLLVLPTELLLISYSHSKNKQFS